VPSDFPSAATYYIDFVVFTGGEIEKSILLRFTLYSSAIDSSNCVIFALRRIKSSFESNQTSSFGFDLFFA